MIIRFLALIALATGAASAQTSVVWTAPVPSIMSIDASADGTRLAVGSGRSGARGPAFVRLRDAADGTVLLDLDGYERNFPPPDAVAVNETGSRVASIHNFSTCVGQGSCSIDTNYRVWTPEGVLETFGEPSYFTHSVDLHGGRLAVGVYFSREVAVRDAATGGVLQTVALSADLETLAFSPDSLLLVTGSALEAQFHYGDGRVEIHPLDGSPARAVDIAQAIPYAFAFSPDNTLLAVGTVSGQTFEDTRVLVIRLADAAVLLNAVVVSADTGVYGGVASPAFTADGGHLVLRIQTTTSTVRTQRLDVMRISDGAVVLSEPVQPAYTAIARIPGTNRVAYADGSTLVVRSFDMGNAVASEPPRGLAMTLAVAPNPSAGAATVRVTLPSAEAIRVSVVDALGRTAAVLHDGTLGAGEHALSVRGLAPGVYTVRVQGAAGVSAQRLTVVR